MASKKISLTKPKYQQIAVDVAEKIAEGKLHVGDKIHARSTLANQYQVSPETARKAQEVVNKLAEAGVKGILNFTAARLVAPPEVLIQNVDLTNELQTLIYFLHHDNELIDEEE